MCAAGVDPEATDGEVFELGLRDGGGPAWVAYRSGGCADGVLTGDRERVKGWSHWSGGLRGPARRGPACLGAPGARGPAARSGEWTGVAARGRGPGGAAGCRRGAGEGAGEGGCGVGVR